MSTLFLAARASFLEGVGRLFDFAGTLTEFNESLNPEQADAFAMRADWLATGNDLRAAVQAFPSEQRRIR